MKKHKLIIKSLHDAQAECKCGRWVLICTGERTRAEIREEFDLHLRNERNYRRRHKK